MLQGGLFPPPSICSRGTAALQSPYLNAAPPNTHTRAHPRAHTHTHTRIARSQVDQLFSRVQEHDDAIIRLDATLEKNAVRARLHHPNLFLTPLPFRCP